MILDKYKSRGRRGSRAPMEDGEIIDLYWARSEQAIGETDFKYGNYLFTVAYNILNDRLDCEECVSDTYLGAWNRIPPARPSVFHVFLSRMTRNISINRYKYNTAAKRIHGGMLVPLEELEDSIELSSDAEDDEAVRRLSGVFNEFVGEMSEREEFIFVCRYYYSDPVGRIARMLGVSVRTVERDLVRLRERLRARLGSEGFDV